MLSSDNAGSGMDIVRRYNGNYNVRLVTMCRKNYAGARLVNTSRAPPLHHPTTSPLHRHYISNYISNYITNYIFQLHPQLHQLHPQLHHDYIIYYIFQLHLPTAPSNNIFYYITNCISNCIPNYIPQLHHLAASPNYIVHCIP